MRRLGAVPVAALFVLATVALAAPLISPSEPASAQAETDWSGYEPDADLAINASDGLNDTELEAVVSRAMVRVETVRGISFENRPPVTVVTREEFRTEYAGRGSDPTDNQSTFRNAEYRALFLVGGDEDAAAVQAENRNTSVAGVYTPSTGEIVVVAEGDQPRVNEPVLAHELFHAYQDQRWGLENYDARLHDARNAELGLIEGDATYLETLYQQRCESGEWGCVTPAAATDPGESDRPQQPANTGLLLLSFQPYDDGPAFIETIRDGGGWGAVDALYGDPPTTAEEVIDPDAYPDETPRGVTIEDDSSDEWDRVRPENRPDHDRLGMAAITTMFVDPLYESGGTEWIVPADEWFAYEGENPPPYGALNYDSTYAAGWDGDRFQAYEREDGAVGYVWRLAWDSPEDATTFVDGFDELLDYRGADRIESDTYVIDGGGYEGAYHVAVEDDVVTITHAPDTDSLSNVRAAAEPGTEDVPAAGNDSDGQQGGESDWPGFAVALVAVVVVVGAALLAARRR